jgi:hypothetical protein
MNCELRQYAPGLKLRGASLSRCPDFAARETMRAAADPPALPTQGTPGNGRSPSEGPLGSRRMCSLATKTGPIGPITAYRPAGRFALSRLARDRGVRGWGRLPPGCGSCVRHHAGPATCLAAGAGVQARRCGRSSGGMGQPDGPRTLPLRTGPHRTRVSKDGWPADRWCAGHLQRSVAAGIRCGP